MKSIKVFWGKHMALTMVLLLVLASVGLVVAETLHERRIVSSYLEEPFFFSAKEIPFNELKDITARPMQGNEAVILSKSFLFLGGQSTYLKEMKNGSVIWADLPQKSAFSMADQTTFMGGRVWPDKPVFSGLFIVIQISPFFLFIIVIISQQRAFARFGGKVGGFLERTARKLTNVPVTFADVAGIDNAVVEAREIVECARDPELRDGFGYKIPRGFLLHGPPGCGKTLLVRAIAGEAKAPFFSMSGSEFEGILVAAGAEKLLGLYETAREAAAKAGIAFVFIDEFEILGRSRGGGSGSSADASREQTTATLNTLLDGIEANPENVVLLAATNRRDLIDPAILRPGRFSKQIYIGEPDRIGREAILKIHIRQRPIAEDVDLAKLARMTPNFAGAWLADLVNVAAGRAMREYKIKLAGKLIDRLFPKKITMQHFLAAMGEVLAGPAKNLSFTSVKEKEIVAAHEVGHALLARVLPSVPSPKKVSAVPHERALGYMWYPGEEDKHLYFMGDLEETIIVKVAGREAEILVFGDYTDGSVNDFEQATEIARKIIFSCGPQYYGGKGDMFSFKPSEMSDVKKAALEERVSQLMGRAAAKAAEQINRAKPVFDELRQALLRESELGEEELEKIFSKIPDLPQKKIS